MGKIAERFQAESLRIAAERQREWHDHPLQVAEREGREARIGGFCRSENPYGGPSPRSFNWSLGWMRANAEIRAVEQNRARSETLLARQAQVTAK